MSTTDIRVCCKGLVSAIVGLANALSEESVNEGLRTVIAEKMLEPSCFYESLIQLSMRLIMVGRMRELGFEAALGLEIDCENSSPLDDSAWARSVAQAEADVFRLLMGTRRLDVGVSDVPFAHLGLCDASANTFRCSIRSTVQLLSEGGRLGAVYEELLNYTAVWTEGRLNVQVMKGYRRKSHGAYYTPDSLVKFALTAVIEELMGQFNSEGEKARTIYICDPACGDGLFLTRAFDELTATHRGSHLSAVQAIRGLCGVDVDEQAVELARFNLALCAEFDHSAMAYVAANIRRGDSLFSFLSKGSSRSLEEMSRKFEQAGDLFHWQQEFGDVFRRQGGFDLVVGNPPWEKLEVNNSEYFAGREGHQLKALTREERMKELNLSQPDLVSRYEQAKAKRSALRSFVKRSGFYPLTAHGRLNAYSLFAELSLRLAGPEGRVHLFLPTGIVTDFSTRHFVASLLENQLVRGLFDFDNRSRFFSDVQGNVQFCLLCLGRQSQSQFRICTGVKDVRGLSMEHGFQLDLESVRLVNPETKAIPMFASDTDAAIIEGLHRKFQIFSRSDWAPRLRQGTYNMTSSAHLFVRAKSRVGEPLVPVYEAKLCHQYHHRHGTFEGVSMDRRFGRHPATKPPQLSSLKVASYEVEPRYWVDEADAHARLDGESWALVFRNTFSSAADARSLVATILPAVGIGNSLSLVETNGGAPAAAVLCSLFNSMLMDYLVRQKSTGSNLNFYVIRQLPVPNRSFFEQVFDWTKGLALGDWLAARCLQLSYTSTSLKGFAQLLSVCDEPFVFDVRRRTALRVEIDAGMFLAMGLARSHVVHIMERFEVLKRKEQRLHGCYRYRDDVLRTYDALNSQSKPPQ